MNKVQALSVVVIVALIATSFLALSMPVQNTRWQNLENYMKENYDDPVDNGEGAYTFPDSESAQLYPTVGAIMAYDEMDMLSIRPPVIDLVMAKNFTQKLQWKSGGEDHERWGGFSTFIAGPVSIENSYWAINMWEILDKQSDIPHIDEIPSINATSALIYVNKTQTSEGGFGSHVGAPADIISTYYALYIINRMTEMNGDPIEKWLWNATLTTEWILNCSEGPAFKLTPESHIPGVTATAAALLALDELDQLSVLSATEQQDIRNWVVQRQVIESIAGEPIGGFTESVLTNDTNLESTYHAFEIFNLIGGFESIDSDLVAQFILDCQASDGTWGNVPGLEEGALFYAGLAIRMLNILDPVDHVYRNMVNEIDPHTQAEPIVDWRLLFIVGAIILAAAMGLIALRID